MNIQKIKYWLLPVAFLMIFAACQPKEFELDEFDINLPKSEITDFSPKKAIIGTDVTLTGINLDDKSLKVYIGSVECKIVEKTSNSVKITLPRIIQTGFFTTINSFGARFESTEKFTPIFPESKVNYSFLRDTIFKAVNYTIIGENLDLITEVIFSDTTITIDGTTVKDPTKLLISCKEKSSIKSKFKAIEKMSFKCKAGNEVGEKKNIVVMDNYPSANLIAVDPKQTPKGNTVKFIFDNYTYATLIKEIKIGTKVATFSSSEPYLLVTIPSDASSGAIEVKNVYGVALKYADGLFISLN